MALGGLQFAAFLSYSRHDKRLALWLVRALEEFSPPHRTIVDLKARHAAFLAPKPIFRDESDMPVGGAVPDRLNEVLDSSASMIVLCTPASAKSAWVNEEVKLFARRHPDRPIIAAVSEGDPDCIDCYPPALFAMGKPLAADLRIPGERRQSIVKIAAAILHLDVDELVGRVRKREARRLMLLAAGGAIAAAIVIGLTTIAGVMNDRANKSDDLARANIERLLTDTRADLDEVGLLKAKAAVHTAARAYFDSKAGKRLDSKDLFLKAEWLRQEGVDALKRGEDDQALRDRNEAYAATLELLKREPRNPDYLFSHAQSAYYVGEFYYMRGDWDATWAPWDSYRVTAEKLFETAPGYPGAALEVHYAHVNMGTLSLQRDRAPRIAAKALKSAIDVLDSSTLDANAKLNLSRTHVQYVEALAQFAPAADVVAAVHAWEPLLRDLEASGDGGDAIKFHLANAWDKIIAVKDRSGIKAASKDQERVRGPEDDPDNLVSLSFAAELGLLSETPDCKTLPQPDAQDLADRAQLRLLNACLARMPVKEETTRCGAFAAALQSQPDQLDDEDVWALVLAQCGKFALRLRNTVLSKSLDDVAAKRFFSRNFEEMRLWTQLAISRFPARQHASWITNLKTSLDNRGWKPSGGK